LRGNLAAIRARVGEGVPVHPVVKADAYGHGAVPVARALEAAGADGLCVATYDEAVALRLGSIRRPILVLYPIPPAWAADAARRRIAVTAGDGELLAAVLEAVTGRPARGALRLHLEVETGLGRGGLQGPALVAAARAIAAAPGARLEGLWTHFQASEERAATATQLERFEAAAADLKGAGVRLPPRHVAASGAIVMDGVAAYDGVRPGLAIYGLMPDELEGAVAPAVEEAFRPVLSLHARPVRVVDLPAGWGISYGPTFRTSRPSRIATLPLGYGDGWPRALSNRAEVLVRGQRAPLVGNVAMDAVMADVSDIPGPPVTTTSSCSSAGRGGPRSRSRRWRAIAPRTPGKRLPPWLGGCLGCTMRDPDRRGSVRSSPEVSGDAS
jgi:alanine racemase